jgi:hypothetical protein
MTARQILASLLAVAALVLGLVGVVSLHARDEIVRPRPFAANAVESLDRAPVHLAVEREIAAQVLERLPPALVSRGQVERIVGRVVDTVAFRRAFHRAALQANRALFQRDDGSAELRLRDVAPAFDAIDPRLGALLAPEGSQRLLRLRSEDLGVDTRQVADTTDTLARIAPPLALVALIGALLLATDRRAVLRLLGVGAALAGVVLLLGLALARSLVLEGVRSGSGVTMEQAHDAGTAIWDVYAGGLKTWAFGAIVAGLLVAVLSFVPIGGARSSRPSRSGGRVPY